MGLPGNQKGEVAYLERKIKLEDVLNNLPVLEELNCDQDLEEYILKEHATKGFLPKLKFVNGLPLRITDTAEREKLQKVRMVANKLQFLARVYHIA